MNHRFLTTIALVILLAAPLFAQAPKTWIPPKTPWGDPELLEYACHEGNYAMSDILSGARAAEKR